MHRDSVDIVASVEREDDGWDPQAVAGQMIKKIRFLSQACRRPSGLADDDTAGTEPCVHDRVAVPAAEHFGHLERTHASSSASDYLPIFLHRCQTSRVHEVTIRCRRSRPSISAEAAITAP
jgi:hypothetical protein